MNKYNNIKKKIMNKYNNIKKSIIYKTENNYYNINNNMNKIIKKK